MIDFRHQLETPDQALCENLNLPGNAGQQLKAAKNLPAAIAIVAHHFRNRNQPRWSYYMHGTPWHETDAPGPILRKADRLLAHTFINSWSPHQEFDLQSPAAPPGQDDPDWKRGLEEASTSLARHTFVTELSTAFAHTGNPAYPTQALALMRSYSNTLPFILHPRFAEDHDTYFGGESNQTLHVAYRMFRWIDFLHSGAFHAKKPDGSFLLPDADLFWIIKQLWFFALQYHRLLADPMRRDNHHLVDHGHTPYVTGLIFPEFKISKALVTAGEKVIHHHFGGNLLPDGSYAEHSAEYQYHILYHFLHPQSVAEAVGVKLLSPKQITALRNWVQFSVRAVKPTGWLPGIGDSDGRPIVHLLGSLAGVIMTPQLASAAKALGIAPGKNVTASMGEISRKMQKVKPNSPGKIGLSAYFLQKSKTIKGICKEPLTSQYPAGGYTFFRNSWTPDADYLAISHFPPNIPGGHAHWDPMSFILHTKGRTLIGEPASKLYENPKFHLPIPKVGDPGGLLYRGYSYSVNAHNCLVVNDDFLKPLQAMCHNTFWGGHPPTHTCGLFHAGGPIEVAEISNDANAPIRHRRFTLHLPNLGFIFIDILQSKKIRLAPMQYSQYFHLEGDVEFSPTPSDNGDLPHESPVRVFDGPAQCLILPGRETESRWRAFRDPYLHDLYRVPNQKGLPWILELTRRIRGNAVFTTFLLTNPALNPSPAQYLGQKTATLFDWQREAISSHKLNLGKYGDLLIASCPFNTPATGEIATDAELAVVHLDKTGKLKTWALARGSHLALAGKTLFRDKHKEWIHS